MNIATSLYLDCLRFFAALLVLLYHSGFTQIANGLPGAWGHFGNEAVIIFFVLSGYVIAHVSVRPSSTLGGYVISRLSRLWSVVIPALILTAIVDTAGNLVRPDYYANLAYTHSFVSFALSAIFMNETWNLHYAPGLDYPFWSISYEFWYYCIFAAWRYAKGPLLIVMPIFVAVCAGPKILSLFPIWILGALAYAVAKRGLISPAAGLFVWLATLAAAAAYVYFDLRMRMIYGPLTPEGWTNAVAIGIITATNIIAFAAMSPWVPPPPTSLRNAIHFASGRTFSIYLFHYPLLVFFAALLWPWREHWRSTIAIYCGTALVILLLAPFTESQKNWVAARLTSKKWQTPTVERRGPS